MRSGQLLVVWDNAGTTWTEFSTPDLNAPTAAFKFSVNHGGATIDVVANIAAGTWRVSIGTRIVF